MDRVSSQWPAVSYAGWLVTIAIVCAPLCANDDETKYPVKFRLRAT
jgi:hypothetical protein